MKLFAYFFLAVLSGLIGFYLVYEPVDRLGGTVLIEVVPTDATLLLDGEEIDQGEHTLDEGSYEVTARFEGFENRTQTIVVKDNQESYVGLILNPNTEETNNWYVENPEENKIAEGVSSKSVDNDTETTLENTPLLQSLPIYYGNGQGGLVKIESGVPLPGTDTPAVYVTASSPDERKGVLTFLLSRGYDLSGTDFVFSGEVIPLGAGVRL